MKQAEEAWAICGRRGGKTRIMATVAAWLAAFVDWRPHLGPGEVATIMLIAANRKQARTALRYLRSLFLDHATLTRLVARETDESLELTNRVVIEVQTASYRVVRGYTVAAVLADELAYWIVDAEAANPADEILEALRPAMATMPGAMLMVATSPYSRRGPVWDAHRWHYGKNGDPILVWQAPTRRMNLWHPRDHRRPLCRRVATREIPGARHRLRAGGEAEERSVSRLSPDLEQ
jgi:phage terminase large subunit-like protein